MIVHVTLELCILQNPQELMLWNIILTTVNFLQLREDHVTLVELSAFVI